VRCCAMIWGGSRRARTRSTSCAAPRRSRSSKRTPGTRSCHPRRRRGIGTRICDHGEDKESSPGQGLRDEHLVETALAAHHPVSGAQFKARKRRTIERGTMMDRAAIRQFIVDDREKGLFRVNRRVFTDPDILEIERREIFDRCWLYAAHEAELARPGDFLTRTVGG